MARSTRAHDCQTQDQGCLLLLFPDQCNNKRFTRGVGFSLVSDAFYCQAARQLSLQQSFDKSQKPLLSYQNTAIYNVAVGYMLAEAHLSVLQARASKWAIIMIGYDTGYIAAQSMVS